MRSELIKYVQLIQGFVDGIVPVHNFEKDYLQLVKNEAVIFDDRTGQILETLFSDVDAYCSDPEIANYDHNDPFANITENELRERAKSALEQLRSSVDRNFE